MKLTKKQIGITAASALALTLASGAALAQKLMHPDEREVWMENSRTMVWRNAYGECWHSFYGPPPSPNECRPAPVAQYVAPVPVVTPPPPAPVVIQPAPPPAPAPLPPRKTRG